MIHIARAGSVVGQFSATDITAGLKSGRFVYSDYFYDPKAMEWLPLSLFIPEAKKKEKVLKHTQFKPTSEQENICNNLPKPGELMIINAYAGSGKTETLRLIAERYPDIKFTYLCYNRDTADKAKRRFSKNTKCCTIHSLAYAAVGRYYKPNYRMPSAKEVMQRFDVKLPYVAVLALEAINKFCNSTEVEISMVHFGDNEAHGRNILKKYPQLVSLAHSIWDEMIKPDSLFPISHDAYLKLWSFKSPIIPGEVILHDESQDMNPVTLQILSSQKANLNPAIIFVGDTHQAIYHWRGAINTMELLNSSATCRHKLTTSFRFSQKIADEASKILQHLKGDSVKIIGLGPTKANIPEFVYIARKNVTLIEMAVSSIKENPNQRFHFAGTRLEENWDPYYLYEFQKPIDLLNLSKGRPERVVLDEIKKFESFQEVIDLIKGDEDLDGIDQELEWYITKLVDRYNDELPDLINKIRSHSVSPQEAHLSFSTAHRSKGLEWKNVIMMDDFKSPDLITLPLSHKDNEEANAIYVAMTRASSSINYGSTVSSWLEKRNLLQ
jgi:F-box protein, helicase, 18